MSTKIRYRGVAVFGAPGSGKTTIAQELAERIPNAVLVEASRLVIFPAAEARAQNTLPKTERAFVRWIVDGARSRRVRPVPRDAARQMFITLKRRYSPAVIAHALVAVHQKCFPRTILIISGIRGYQNALTLRKQGYVVVYLAAPEVTLAKRMGKRERYSRKEAERERVIEQRLFSTNKVERIAQHTANTAYASKEDIAKEVIAFFAPRTCARCANSSNNPAVTMVSSGLCETCQRYRESFRVAPLRKELVFVRSLIGSGQGEHDAMVGISGGKDSTATLYEVLRMGFTPIAFTLDTGYYPAHIIPRARSVAKAFDVAYEHIDIRGYITATNRMCYEKTAALYDMEDSEPLKQKFRKWYREGRRHYSVKCRHRIPFVRTCQLCRRIVVRAYYSEAVRRGVRVVILGMNEWAGLSQNDTMKTFHFSAVRELKPYKTKPAVYIVHLPFLLQRRIADTRRVLQKLGWTIPSGEALIESNANSCLFARAAEEKAKRMLGFHPDASRLSREVTVGFISKRQALHALAKRHPYPKSVRRVLEDAGIL